MNDFVNYLLSPAVQVALIMGLAELWKKVELPVRWVPVVDLLVGLVFGFLVYHDFGFVKALMIGLAEGLSACGLFSGIKNVLEANHGSDI